MANYTRFQLRGDTKANWLSVNPILAKNEPAIETDTNRFKIGDGVSTYSQLSYGRNTVEYSSLYNVTSLFPLPSGFYEHSTAILAIPSGERTLGLIITYETASGVWYTERFIGTDIANWGVAANWEKLPDAGDLAQLRSDLNKISHKNLFNPETVLEGYYYTDQQNPNVGFWLSDYIAVNPSSAYNVNKTFTFVSFFDINKVYITNLGVANSKAIKIPSNCYYIRISEDFLACNYKDNYMLEYGLVSTYYEPYQLKVKVKEYKADHGYNSLESSKTVKDIENEIYEYIYNLFDKSKVLDKGYVVSGTYNLSLHNDFWSGDFIKVKPSTIYNSKNGFTFGKFYDINGNVISSIASAGTTSFITPSNCYCFRYSAAYTESNPETEMLVEGVKIYDYISYENPLKVPNFANANLESIMSIVDDSHTYGQSIGDSIYSYFPRSEHVDYSATTTNSESPSDGYLTEISTKVVNGGIFVFKVGLLDQYSRFVESRRFELNLSNGVNIVDVSSLNIPISKGQQIAISITDKAINGTGSLSYNQNNESSINNELFFGMNNGVWSKLATTYGGMILLSYKIRQINSSFATKDSIEAANTRIDNQSKQIDKLRYVYDENGAPFKLSIYNGQILIKSVQYKNVLALGNSLTSHAFNLGIGYHGDDSWAMASTNKVTTTWTKHLQTVLQQKQNTAVVTPFNIFEWETNYMGVDLSALFATHIGTNYDLIVFRAGENGVAGDDYTQGVDRLITYLRTNFPQADIIFTDMFWHTSYKESCFRTIADKYSYPYYSFGNISDSCLLGQMTMGVDDIMYPIIHGGVASHCTDVCFYEFANILANSLGYNEISGKHTLNIATTSVQYSINSLNQIKDGYVSILTYGANAPTIVATGATTSNNIAVTHHDIKATTWINTPSTIPTFVTTFLMPDEDVIINIS